MSMTMCDEPGVLNNCTKIESIVGGKHQIVKTTPILHLCRVPLVNRTSNFYCWGDCLSLEDPSMGKHPYALVCESDLIHYVPNVRTAENIVIHAGNYNFNPEAIPVELKFIQETDNEGELEDYWTSIFIYGKHVSVLWDFGAFLYRLELQDDDENEYCLSHGETVYVLAEEV